MTQASPLAVVKHCQSPSYSPDSTALVVRSYASEVGLHITKSMLAQPKLTHKVNHYDIELVFLPGDKPSDTPDTERKPTLFKP